MRRSLHLCLIALSFAAATTGAMAQYAGPSAIPLTTVKALIDDGKDDQHATLRGRIIAHTGGDGYTFADTSGQIRVEIDARLFPAGQPVDDKQVVEITGEFEKGWRSVEFDVEKLVVVR